MLRYALTIFLSAFLLFQVQPLISKIILPWFGGGPSVWTTCMVFFQVALLGGYAYAHVVGMRVSQRRQVVVHLVVLAIAVAVAASLLYSPPNASWKLVGNEEPAWRILGLLAVTVGLPYFALSTTGPLLQAWFSRTNPGKSPYRLYALSNVGSLLALLSFPFLVEPWMRSSVQMTVWSVAFAAFAIACGYCAIRTWNVAFHPEGAKVAEGEKEAKPPCFWDYVFWLGLPACASVLLLAMTNHICQDVAVVPFLWVVPLSLYLLSFIICFDSERWYFRPVFWPAFTLALVAIVYLMYQGVSASLTLQVAGLSGGLFVCCMVCHGELVRLKPKPRYLTSFYLMVSAGGAIGGIFVGLIAPLVFRMHLELHLGLWVCLAMVMEAIWYQMKPQETWRPAWLVWVGLAVCLAALVGFGWVLQGDVKRSLRRAVSVSRSFYGVLTVHEWDRSDPKLHHYSLYNGRIKHGAQFLSEEGRLKATSYYGDQSGVGLALRRLRPEGIPLRVGVIGLGTGTIAAHGKAGDHYTFYEINSQVKKLSEARFDPDVDPETRKPVGGYFTYLKDLEARGGTYDIAMGDARLSLERQPSQQFDLLAIDAFTSDAIPVHLLTREVFKTYDRHLKPDGILAVHISNRYLDLKPVVWALADLYKYQTALIDSEDDDENLVDGAVWMLVTKNKRFLHDDSEVVKATAPGGKPGLNVDDLLLEINQVKVRNLDEVRRLLAAAKAGSTATLKVLRGRVVHVYEVALADPPADGAESEPGTDSREANPRLGLTLVDLTPDLTERMARKGLSSLAIVTVEENGPAAKAKRLSPTFHLWTDDYSNLFQILN